MYEKQTNFADIYDELSRAGLEYAGDLAQIYDNDGSALFLDSVGTRKYNSNKNLMKY